VSRSLDILHFSLHGLIRGTELELGRDADTGGQCLYVLELVKALSRHPAVKRVTLVTRRISDPRVSTDYAKPHEDLGHGAEIRRIDGGPKLYRRKEVLWRHLDAMVDNTLAWLRRERRVPDVIHAHYADAGYVGRQVAAVLGCPFVFTGHSLGRVKRLRMLESGLDETEIEKRYNLNVRIEAEELSLDAASFVCTSTHQEIEQQYALYDQYAASRMRVIPPGVDLTRFDGAGDEQAFSQVHEKVSRFLSSPDKPAILTIARADERKNLAGLVHAFGGNAWLREHANLVIVGGNRQTIDGLSSGARRVWVELLKLIDDYDLRGNCAVPKTHTAPEVPEFYRWAAERKGVFVNPAFTEPFGLTLLEAAAAGLPMVATHDGGPRDILENCKNGVLIDPMDHKAIGAALVDILSHPEKQQELAAHGAQAVREHYSWSAHVGHYLREVQAVLPKVINTDSGAVVRPLASSAKLASSERWIVMDIPSDLEDESPENLERWRALFADGSIGFGIATGMSYQQTQAVILKYNLPQPSFVVSRLGARIDYYRAEQGQGVCDEGWQHQISVNWKPQDVIKALEDVPGVELQPADNQDPLKVSFYRDPAKGPKRRDVQQRLREKGIAAKVLISANVYLDILPIRSGKDVALRYLMHRWGIDPSSIFYFATQGNDAAVMRGKTLAVVAGGSDPQLKNLSERIRLRHSEHSGLAGMFEGLEAYGFLEGKKPPLADEGIHSDNEVVSVDELLP